MQRPPGTPQPIAEPAMPQGWCSRRDCNVQEAPAIRESDAGGQVYLVRVILDVWPDGADLALRYAAPGHRLPGVVGEVKPHGDLLDACAMPVLDLNDPA